MGDQTQRPIPTPIPRRLLRWRQRYLPVAVWVVAVAIIGALGHRQMGATQRVAGVVETREAAVTPHVDGTLSALHVGLFDTVEAGQLVAQLDDTVLRIELTSAETELARLQGELSAAAANAALTALDQASELRRFHAAAEIARINHIDRVAQLASDKVTLDLLAVEMENERDLVAEGVSDTFTGISTRLEHDALAAKLGESVKAVEAARQHQDQTAARLANQENRLEAVASDQLVEPYRLAVAAQERLIEGIRLQHDRYALRAPMTGNVATIFHRPGETVPLGTPVLTITDPTAARILAYVDERQFATLAAGDPVKVASRAAPAHLVTASIIETSPRVEMFPEHLLNRLGPQWGQPVLLGAFPEDLFRPGEAVTVYLRGRR